MKRLLWITFFAGILMTAGCSKNDDNGPAVNNFITFSLDGAPISCNSGMSLSFPQGKELTVNGAWAGGSIKLEVFEDFALVEGSYPFQANQYRRATLTVGSTVYTAGSTGGGSISGFGSLNIIDIDPNYVSGEFEFETAAVGGASKLVLDGNFKIAR